MELTSSSREKEAEKKGICISTTGEGRKVLSLPQRGKRKEKGQAILICLSEGKKVGRWILSSVMRRGLRREGRK